MEIQGKIYKVLPTRTGKKADGSEWRSQEFIVEFFESPDQRWSDKVVLNAMNDRIDEYKLREGDEVRVGFSHGVREYQGKYYPEFRIYKFEKVGAQPQPAVNSEPQPTVATAPQAQQSKDDLPF
jgi:hypothetical protein